MYQDLDFLVFTQDLIKPEHFSDKVLSWFFTSLRDHYLDYQKPADEVVINNELIKASKTKIIAKQEDIQAHISCFEAIKSPVLNPKYIKDEIINFCKTQAVKKAVSETPNLLTARDFETLSKNFNEAVLVGNDIGGIGIDFFKSVKERAKERILRNQGKTIPTGMLDLDIYLNGGLKPKQLGIWMGPGGRGKSAALCQCGRMAIFLKKKVLHYTLELSEEDVAERYDSMFSKIKVNELVDKEFELINTINQRETRWGSSLIIKEFPAHRGSLATLAAHYMMCVRSGFVPDLILIDYLDLLKPTHKRLQKREELSDLATETRGWAHALKIPIWTATQSQRAAISMDTHTEEQVGEDIGKINIADVVITINQTKEEVAIGQMRLFIGKNRNGPKYAEVKFISDLARMSFYDPMGVVDKDLPKKEEKPKAKKALDLVG
jgi:replicative DNA helicase